MNSSGSPVELAMFLENALVHNDFESGFARAAGGGFVDHAFLQPQRFRADTDRGLDDFRNMLRAAENIDHVDPLRNIFQTRVTFFAEHFGFMRIHRNDAVSDALHVIGDAVGGTHRARGKSDDGDGARALQEISYARHDLISVSSENARPLSR